jgi:hypothetical protein
MNPKASRRVLNPPLRGIVQLTNSATLRFRNWSFNNKFVTFLNLKEGGTTGMEGWTEEEIRDKNLMAPCGLYCGA